MRITGNTVVRRYISNLERNYSNKNDSENKISSNSKFTRASQNPIEAAGALKVRKALAELNHQYSNLENAKNVYSNAESAIMGISDLIQTTYEQLIYGANGSLSAEEDEILATSIETYADEMVRELNLTVADRKIFGGTNNTTSAFAITNGKVTYNGVNVNDYQDADSFPFSQPSFSDIGIGMTNGSGTLIDEQSALQITFNGAAVMGCGVDDKSVSTINLDSMTSGAAYSLDITVNGTTKQVDFTAGGDAPTTKLNINTALSAAFGNDNITVGSDGVISESSGLTVTVQNNTGAANDADINTKSDGYSINIIQLTLDAARALRSGDKKLAARYADKIFASQTTLSLSIADIGNKEKFIDFNLDRLTNNQYSLYDRQNSLEGTDLGTEITNWKMLESIYNASLQMGTATLSRSIFDFM